MIYCSLLARASRPGTAPAGITLGRGFQPGTGRLAATAGLLAAVALAAAGCGPGSPASSRAAGTTAAAARSAAASGAGSAAAPAAAPGVIPAATIPALSATADSTYLAESQDPRGTIVRAPGCAHGCPLSGDGTIVLYDMTWPAWTAAQAVGRGTESIESCIPNCSAGGQYKVAVIVTLRDPVRYCTPQGTLWIWTRASFTWPNGLPRALWGQAAPYNPWPFTALKDRLNASCA